MDSLIIPPGNAAKADAATPESAACKQKAYRERRRRWAWKVGRPYSEDTDKPFPGVHDLVDETEG